MRAFGMLSATLLLSLLTGCLTLPEKQRGSLMPALSRAIGVEEERIRLLSAGEWWQQEGWTLASTGARAARAGVAIWWGDSTSTVVLTDDAIHIARPPIFGIEYRAVTRIPYTEVVSAHVITGSSVLALRRRGDPRSYGGEPIVDLIRFFSTDALLAYEPSPKNDNPENAKLAAEVVAARLAPPIEKRLSGTVDVAKRARIVAVVTPRWQPAIGVEVDSAASQQAKEGWRTGTPFIRGGGELAMIGPALGAVVAAAGVVIGAVGAASGAVTGAIADARDERKRAERSIQHAVSGISEVSGRVAGHEAIKSCLLGHLKAISTAEISDTPKEARLLLSVTDLGAKSRADQYAYTPLLDERISRYVEARLDGVHFFSEVEKQTDLRNEELPVHMSVRASLYSGPTDDIRHATFLAAVEETTEAYMVRQWRENQGALVHTQFKLSCERIATKLASEHFRDAVVLLPE
jgi:hypothetical protein